MVCEMRPHSYFWGECSFQKRRASTDPGQKEPHKSTVRIKEFKQETTATLAHLAGAVEYTAFL